MARRKLKTLFTGATGFIGGSVLVAILETPDLISQLDIHALYRSERDHAALEALGITAIRGDLTSDQDLITQLASECDLIIDIAHSDTSVQAILDGAKQRFLHSPSLPKPIYIHTSGTGVLSDDSLGMFEGNNFYDDTNLGDMKRIPDDAWHRDVDLSVYQADTDGYVTSYLVLPALVYGAGVGPGRTESQQIPVLVDLALKRGKAGQVGKGLSKRGSVHVNDLSTLYVNLLERVLSPSVQLPSGWEGTFIGASGHYTWGSLSEVIGQRLFELGLVASPEVDSFTEEELRAIGPKAEKLLGSNSRPIASRAKRDLDWRPKEEGILSFVAKDTDYHLAQLNVTSRV